MPQGAKFTSVVIARAELNNRREGRNKRNIDETNSEKRWEMLLSSLLARVVVILDYVSNIAAGVPYLSYCHLLVLMRAIDDTTTGAKAL